MWGGTLHWGKSNISGEMCSVCIYKFFLLIKKTVDSKENIIIDSAWTENTNIMPFSDKKNWISTPHFDSKNVENYYENENIISPL